MQMKKVQIWNIRILIILINRMKVANKYLNKNDVKFLS